MDIRPIKTESYYDWALAEIEPYFTIPPPLGTPEAERFDVLAVLIEPYEAHHWAIDPPDPVTAIRIRMVPATLNPTWASSSAHAPAPRKSFPGAAV